MSDRVNSAEVIATDEDGNRIFFDGSGNALKFMKSFKNYLSSIGLGGVFDAYNDEAPVRPDEAFNRRDGLLGYGRYDQVQDGASIDRYLRALEKWNPKCQRALAIFKRALDKTVLSTMNTLVRNMNNANYDNLVRISTEFMNYYSAHSIESEKINRYKIASIKYFMSPEDVSEGLKMHEECIEEQEYWNMRHKLDTDDVKLDWLITRMSKWDQISFLYNRIKTMRRDTTFSAAKKVLMEEMNDLRVSKKLRPSLEAEMAIAAICNTDTITKTDRVKPNIPTDSIGYNLAVNTITMEQRIANLEAAATAAQRNNNYNKKSTYSQRFSDMQNTLRTSGYNNKSNQYLRPTKCGNCGDPAHFARDCTALLCSRCSKQWESVQSPGYHKSQECTYVAITPTPRKAKGQWVQTGQGATNKTAGYVPTLQPRRIQPTVHAGIIDVEEFEDEDVLENEQYDVNFSQYIPEDEEWKSRGPS